MRISYKLAACLALVLIATNVPFLGNSQSLKKIVMIAGNKTHDPGEHEYIRTVRLLKVMLDHAPNLKGIKTEIHFNGWPADPTTLNDADLILVYADGSDDKEEYDPLFTGDHWSILEKQMNRGCGLILLHFSTFAPMRYGPKFIEWEGGYFDYETGKAGASGSNTWYSAIKTETARIKPVSGHPITQGLSPFDLHDEYYYKIRFQENDKRLVPILNASIKGVDQEQTVAWAVERNRGGRGFGFTGCHYYNNWEVPNFRKMILNAIVWTAGGNVPPGGVESKYYHDEEVAALLGNLPTN